MNYDLDIELDRIDKERREKNTKEHKRTKEKVERTSEKAGGETWKKALRKN